MVLGITGATGHLGRLVIESLLKKGVEPSRIVALVRSPEKAADLAERGIQVRKADYDQPDTLGPALEGIDRLLLISSSEVGRRIPQHRSVVDAAVKAGVGFIAYTSAPKADTIRMLLASDHKATEEIIRASGLPFTFLRNGWYLEVYTGQIPQYLQNGAIFGSADNGRISGAARADFAEAAAAVLTGEGHEGAVYELGGDEAFTMADLAAEITKQTGKTVVYRDMPVEEYEQVLIDAGLPDAAAAVYADIDVAIARGDLFIDSGDLHRLIGRPTTLLSDAIAAALAA